MLNAMGKLDDKQLAISVRTCNKKLRELEPMLDVALLKRKMSKRDRGIMTSVSYWMNARNAYAEEMRNRNLNVPDDFVQ